MRWSLDLGAEVDSNDRLALGYRRILPTAVLAGRPLLFGAISGGNTFLIRLKSVVNARQEQIDLISFDENAISRVGKKLLASVPTPPERRVGCLELNILADCVAVSDQLRAVQSIRPLWVGLVLDSVVLRVEETHKSLLGISDDTLRLNSFLEVSIFKVVVEIKSLNEKWFDLE